MNFCLPTDPQRINLWVLVGQIAMELKRLITPYFLFVDDKTVKPREKGWLLSKGQGQTAVSSEVGLDHPVNFLLHHVE